MRRGRNLAFRKAVSVALALSMTAGTAFTNVGMQVYAAEQAAEEVSVQGKEEDNSGDIRSAEEKNEEDGKNEGDDRSSDGKESNEEHSDSVDGAASTDSDSDDTTDSSENSDDLEKSSKEQDDSSDTSKEQKDPTDSDDQEDIKNSDDQQEESKDRDEDSASEKGNAKSGVTEKGNVESGVSEKEQTASEEVKDTEKNGVSDKNEGEDAGKETLEEDKESLTVDSLPEASAVTAGIVEEKISVKQQLMEKKLEELSEKEIDTPKYHNDEGSYDIEEITVPELAVDEDSVSFVWKKPENYKDIADYKVYVTDETGEEKYLGTAEENYEKYSDWADTYRKAFYKHHGDAVKISIHTFIADGLKPDTDYTFSVVPVDKSGSELGGSASVDAHTKKKLSDSEIHNITDYGAKSVEKAYESYNDEINEEIVENTKAIQAAIDACGEDEKVVIPEGIYMSGALYLHSNMTLELEEGAVLKGSPNVDHYDQNYILYPYSTDTRSWSLINVYSADEEHPYENIRIVGEGTIDGNGWTSIKKDNKHSEDPEGQDYRSPQYFAGGNSKVVGDGQGILAKDATKKAAAARGENINNPSKIAYNTRPSLVMIRGTKNFYMEGVTLANPAYHTLAVLDSDTVTTNNVKYLTYDCNNGDGIEIGNTQNAMVYNCFFDTGDDAVNFATGMGKATEDTQQQSSSHIWTFDNVFRECHGGAIAAGSHTGAGISDMLVEDNVLNYADMPFRFKSAPANGGSIHDVLIRDCAVANADQLFVMTTMYSDSNGVSDTETADKPAEFYNIDAYNISCDKTSKNAFSLIADIDANDPSKPEHHHHDLYFQDITVKNSAEFVDKDEDKNGKIKYRSVDKIAGDVLDGIENAVFYNVKIKHSDGSDVWNKIINCSDLHFVNSTESAQTKNAETKPEWAEDAELYIATGSELTKKSDKKNEIATGSELDRESEDDGEENGAVSRTEESDGYSLKLNFSKAEDKDLAGNEMKVKYSVETYVDGGETLVDVSKLTDKTEITVDNLSAGVEYLFKVFAFDETGNKVEGPSLTYLEDALGTELKKPENLVMSELKGEVYTSVPVKLADARKADKRIRGYKIYVDGELKKTYYYYQLGSSKFKENNVTLIVDRLTDGVVDEAANRKENSIRIAAFADDGQEFDYEEGVSTTWQMYDFKAPVWSSSELDVVRDGNDLVLSWDPAEDESGILGYRVYVDGKPVYNGHGDYFNHVNGAYTTEDTTFRISGLDLEKEHVFDITAGDNWWRALKNEAPYHWTVEVCEGEWKVTPKEDPKPEDKKDSDAEKNDASHEEGKPEKNDTSKDDVKKEGTSESSDKKSDDASKNDIRSRATGSSGSRSSDSDSDDGGSGSGSQAGQVLGANRIDASTMGFWSMDEKGWKFSSVNGETAVNKWKQCEFNGTVQWYRFDKDGYIMSGWFTDSDNNIYYLCPLHDGRFGQMLTGWQTIDGKEYYFETEGDKVGRIYANERTPDGHYVGADGVKIR
ncbi:MAG: hypothetical protein E7232_12090 [Lachnospiraceae bacterium]|nr:hypothetical protein [Lachnospiraceae bacterium]